MARPELENNSEKETGTIILPDDVIKTILSILPVKSLLRLKTVSRSWHAIISDPRFSRINYIHRSKSSENLFLMLGWHTGEWGWSWRSPGLPALSLIRLEDHKSRTLSMVEIPFGSAAPFCSCNGIVLLTLNSSRDDVVLWNPSIKKYARIECPLRPRGNLFNYGLYHDSRADDYKVVTISWLYYTVYSCKNRSWTKIKPLPLSRIGLFYPQRGVFVDGSFYWCTQGLEIVCFDVGDEKLKKLPRPCDLKANDTDEVRLTGLSGRLCLYRKTTDWRRLQLWVMEKHGDQNYSYSWRELINMDKEEPGLYFMEPLCLTNEDNLVILLMNLEFVIYNHCEKGFKKLEANWSNLYDLLPYSESLEFPIQNISLKRMQETESATSAKFEIRKIRRI